MSHSAPTRHVPDVPRHRDRRHVPAVAFEDVRRQPRRLGVLHLRRSVTGPAVAAIAVPAAVEEGVRPRRRRRRHLRQIVAAGLHRPDRRQDRPQLSRDRLHRRRRSHGNVRRRRRRDRRRTERRRLAVLVVEAAITDTRGGHVDRCEAISANPHPSQHLAGRWTATGELEGRPLAGEVVEHGGSRPAAVHELRRTVKARWQRTPWTGRAGHS